MSYRLGVDVGGTFTDLALYDVDSNLLEFAKTPSTPADQTAGITLGLQQLVGGLGIPPSEITFFIHGTTVATNALLQRRGARTALVVTANPQQHGQSLSTSPLANLSAFAVLTFQ